MLESFNSEVEKAAGRCFIQLQRESGKINPYISPEVHTQRYKAFRLLRKQRRQSDNSHTPNSISVSEKAIIMYESQQSSCF